MKYRVLTSADKNPCVKMLSANESFRITPPPRVLSLSNYYLNDVTELMSVFGEFSDDGELQACLFASFSTYNRSWTIDYIVKSDNKKLTSLSGLIQYVVAYAEHREYHTMYAVYFDKNDTKCERFLARYCNFMPRYTAATETVISNNKKSSFDGYWERFQKFTMHDRRMIIKQYSLKQIHRTII